MAFFPLPGDSAEVHYSVQAPVQALDFSGVRQDLGDRHSRPNDPL